MLLPVIFFVAISFPIAWFISEFQDRKWLRISLGGAAIAISFLVAAGVTNIFCRLDFNAWYGTASQQLIEKTLQELKADNKSGVVENLTWLQEKYQPTYENRANYDELVAQYVSRFDHGDK